MNLIDRNNKILFQIMEFSEIEETATCLSQVFSQFEPIAKSLNISVDEFYPVALPICQKAATDKLSIIAKDRETGEVVGFMISEDFTTINSTPIPGISQKFEPVFELLLELEEHYQSRHAIQTGQVLHLGMLGVQEKYRKRQIATTLVTENLNLAKQHHFEVAMTEATAAGSQHLFRKLGFTEELAIEYKSYNFKGKNIFSSIESPTHCQLMSYQI